MQLKPLRARMNAWQWDHRLLKAYRRILRRGARYSFDPCTGNIRVLGRRLAFATLVEHDAPSLYRSLTCK